MALAPIAARAQQPERADTVAARALAPGVTYRHVLDPRGPWDLHIVRVDLRRGDVALRVAHARDSLRGRERPSDMTRRATAAGDTVLAAVNADFFDLATGENENEQVMAGEWWKGLKVTDSPYDTYDNVHAQLAVDAAGRPSIDRFMLDAHAWAHDVATPILTVNARPIGMYEGTALYTSRYGATTPRDTAARSTAQRDADSPTATDRPIAEAPLVAAGRHGDTLLYVRRGALSTTTGTPIPPGGAVLASYGPRTTEVKAMADGDTVRVLLATLPRLAHGAVPSQLVGGWPRILQDGRSVAADAATIEGTISRNAEVRHPRTAVAISRDATTLWLVTVDGRTPNSVGMTLVELTDAIRRLGAWNALNFDGGGSTAMILGDSVVNKPSDPTGERAVGNALLIVKRRR